MTKRLIAGCLSAWLLCAATVGAQAPGDPFQTGNVQYAGGNYGAAITAYAEEVKRGNWSANLFYNLGNAHFRRGEPGRAILSYARALALERDHPEAKANLRAARDQAHSLNLTPPALSAHLGFVSSSFYAVATAILFWTGVLMLLWKRTRRIVAAAGCCLIAAAISGSAVYLLEHDAAGKAIVVAPNTQARVATADTAKSIMVLPPGSEVRILQQRGEWSYAELPNNEHGWIAAATAETIRL